jgi:hypothetical protein
MKVIVMERHAEGIQIGEQTCQGQEDTDGSFSDYNFCH